MTFPNSKAISEHKRQTDGQMDEQVAWQTDRHTDRPLSKEFVNLIRPIRLTNLMINLQTWYFVRSNKLLQAEIDET